ncbi:hypothetical protein [Streptomyces sp. NPDC056796]|uniref:hypothetical protein n=1 Tax=Streptomyces sp. NPDC056796 TaxID=3345947 RepID=UPI00367DF728
MRTRRLVVAGWVLLAVGGWAATLWLGEPSATAGPRPAPAAGDGRAPGPQPEGGPCTAPAADPGSTAELLEKVPEGYADGHAVQVARTCGMGRDHAVPR